MDGTNILLPSRPMVMVQRLGKSTYPAPGISVFDVSRSPDVKSSTKRALHSDASAAQHFKFVNTTEPGDTKESKVQRRIRRHARSDQSRLSQFPKKSHPIQVSQPETGPAYAANPTILPNLGLPTALTTYEFPITMHPSFHVLLSRYLTHASGRMYPCAFRFESNPLRTPEWFHFAVTDAAMLHAVLYSGAINVALLSAKCETSESMYHQTKVVSLVLQRLRGRGRRSDDSTLGAISCLAVGAAVTGNEAQWHLHMKGLKQMILARGGISSLVPLLQAKLHRSDVIGAIDYLSPPYLTISRPSKPVIWSTLPADVLNNVKSSMIQLLSTSGLHHALVPIMTELAYFFLAIRCHSNAPSPSRTGTLNAAAFSETLYSIEHKLLSFPTSIAANTSEQAIDRACRLGALLYLEAIVQEFPHSRTGDSVLLAQLRRSLSEILDVDVMAALSAWLAMIGACLARGDLNGWFVMCLKKLRSGREGMSFDELTSGMEGLLSSRSVFGNAVDKIWGDLGEAE